MRLKNVFTLILACLAILSLSSSECLAGPFGDGITFKKSKSKKFRKFVKVKKAKKNQEFSKVEATEKVENTVEIHSTPEKLIVRENTVIFAPKSELAEIKTLPVDSRMELKKVDEVKTVSTLIRPSIAYVSPLSKIGVKDINSKDVLSKKELRQLRKQIRKNKRDSKDVNAASEKAAAIVGYIGPLGWLISYLAMHEEGNEFSAFHLRQSLGIIVTGIAFSIIAIVPILGWIIAIIGSLTLLVLWLIALVGAINGTQKPVPLFGNMYQKWFNGIN